jgi:hypothetical protein
VHASSVRLGAAGCSRISASIFEPGAAGRFQIGGRQNDKIKQILSRKFSIPVNKRSQPHRHMRSPSASSIGALRKTNAAQ